MTDSKDYYFKNDFNSFDRDLPFVMGDEEPAPKEGALDWDAEIRELTPFEYISGKQAFRVKRLERGRYPGGKKLGPCNKAILELEVISDSLKPVTVRETLLLHSSFQNKLVGFFRSIGKWDPLNPKMDWSEVEGSFGEAIFNQRKYTGSDGREYTTNCVEQYIKK